jgi:hypothetical protein
MSEINKLKKKIEMKNLLEDEIEEQLKELAEKAKSILIENDEIFNSGKLEPQIFQKNINLHYIVVSILECYLS